MTTNYLRLKKRIKSSAWTINNILRNPDLAPEEKLAKIYEENNKWL